MIISNHILNYPTPFYLYQSDILRKTIQTAIAESKDLNAIIHYAIKANANSDILKIIQKEGLGADCVSIGEMKKAITAGFQSENIVLAGVGKTDEEISFAITKNIYCINVESIEELKIINSLAKKVNKKAKIALRVSPNIDAHTHDKITTGLSHNKFGIDYCDIIPTISEAIHYTNIELIGLHFHIGSQIEQFDCYIELCKKINQLITEISPYTVIKDINVGGGLGINYQNPDHFPIPNFKEYFSIFRKYLNLEKYQKLHFELGRSIVGQCGSLICKVLYTKNKDIYNFIIVDAGFTDLLRPSFYKAYHKIENLSSISPQKVKYNIVGPICESGDIFAENYELPLTKRGDIISIRSTGAYGESMSSMYNGRKLPNSLII